METEYQHFAGIDVSKAKIDVCIIVNADKSVVLHQSFEQHKKGFIALKKWLKDVTAKQVNRLFICVENTGLYDDALLHYLFDEGFAVSLENAANIKRSVRDNRGKTDKLDARNIALYALKHYDELKLWEKPRKQILLLQQLLSERSRLVNALKALQQTHKEKAGFKWSGSIQSKPYLAGITGLKKDIEQIEKDIWLLIKSDTSLLQMFVLITSIPAVGKITAYHFICYTNEFKQVKSGKQLASYCGVVPFERSSGSSVHYKPRLSQHANKILKTLLHLCAVTAIKTKSAFAQYYKRKKEDNKNGLIIINGIRNKIALTIAAVIRNNEPYNDNYIYQQYLVKP
jgi:transposase